MFRPECLIKSINLTRRSSNGRAYLKLGVRSGHQNAFGQLTHTGLYRTLITLDYNTSCTPYNNPGVLTTKRMDVAGHERPPSVIIINFSRFERHPSRRSRLIHTLYVYHKHYVREQVSGMMFFFSSKHSGLRLERRIDVRSAAFVFYKTVLRGTSNRLFLECFSGNFKQTHRAGHPM